MAKKVTVVSLLQEILDILKKKPEPYGPEPKAQPRVINDRFTDNGDGSFTDKKSTLVWAKEDLPTKMTPAEAVEACKKLGPGWRPADDKDFESIIDRNRYNPAIIPEAEVLGLKTDGWYTTGKPYAANPDNAWYVCIKNGYVNYCSKGSKGYVRPVRVSQ